MDVTRIVRASRLGRRDAPAQAPAAAGERQEEAAGREAATPVSALVEERLEGAEEGTGTEATRIVRASCLGLKAEPVQATAPAEEAPDASRPPPRLPLALERFALVTWVLGRERAAELLDGLGEHEAERAKEHLRRIAALPSAQRQGKVAVEFGERADAGARLKALMEEAPEPLRKALFRLLPPYHRTLFPERRVEPPGPEVPPALEALAERLVREATR